MMHYVRIACKLLDYMYRFPCVVSGFAQPPPSNGYTVVVSQEVKDMETTAVKMAEQGDLNGALEQLNVVVESAPEYPSGYNNRAQVMVIHIHVH